MICRELKRNNLLKPYNLDGASTHYIAHRKHRYKKIFLESVLWKFIDKAIYFLCFLEKI